ncbi:MAG: SAM-dependent chlorinase/fluorinase [Bacteroidota bacterium]|nr:SAM-dependent chlorinase/fluorinase [Bacteroidota bacterium]
MQVISLTTDRKSGDFFIGRVKGEILKSCPSAAVVDLAHDIPTFDISYAAFTIKHSRKNFPEGSIHLIGVDCEEGPKQRHIVVHAHNQYFICADTGIIYLIFAKEEITNIYEPIEPNPADQPAMIRFVHLAKEISQNKDLNSFLKPVEKTKLKLGTSPMYDDSLIIGKIIYVDSYDNAICNISKELFDDVGQGRRVKIYAGSSSNIIRGISKTHLDKQHGEIVALFNSLNLLEISINKGKLMSLLGLKLYNDIRIEFYDNPNS